MIPKTRQELVVGRYYQDIEHVAIPFATIMKFVGSDNELLRFKYVSGNDSYPDSGGEIHFEGDLTLPFYELTDDEVKALGI